MKRLTLIVLLLATPVVAQESGKTFPAGASGGGSFTGGAITSPLCTPDGTQAAPAYAMCNDLTSGWFRANGIINTGDPLWKFSAENFTFIEMGEASSGEYPIRIYNDDQLTENGEAFQFYARDNGNRFSVHGMNAGTGSHDIQLSGINIGTNAYNYVFVDTPNADATAGSEFAGIYLREGPGPTSQPRLVWLNYLGGVDDPPLGNSITLAPASSPTGTNTITIPDVTGTLTLYDSTQQILHPDVGSETEPSYSFTADPDTGMYRHGTNALGFSVAGERMLSLASNLAYIRNPNNASTAGQVFNNTAGSNSLSFYNITGSSPIPKFNISTTSTDATVSIYNTGTNLIRFSDYAATLNAVRYFHDSGGTNYIDLTADTAAAAGTYTITLPGYTGRTFLSTFATNTPYAANSVWAEQDKIMFEGNIADTDQVVLQTSSEPNGGDHVYELRTIGAGTYWVAVTSSSGTSSACLPFATPTNVQLANSLWGDFNTLFFEGSTADANEARITLENTNPTTDTIAYLPDETGILSTYQEGNSTLTDNTPTDILSFPLADGGFIAGTLITVAKCDDTTNVVWRHDTSDFICTNQSDTESCSFQTNLGSPLEHNDGAGNFTGAYTLGVSTAGTNTVTITLTADCSLTPTTLEVDWEIDFHQPEWAAVTEQN
jgi:hypothetical protein